jgi:hypothetical protein
LSQKNFWSGPLSNFIMALSLRDITLPGGGINGSF